MKIIDSQRLLKVPPCLRSRDWEFRMEVILIKTRLDVDEERLSCYECYRRIVFTIVVSLFRVIIVYYRIFRFKLTHSKAMVLTELRTMTVFRICSIGAIFSNVLPMS